MKGSIWSTSNCSFQAMNMKTAFPIGSRHWKQLGVNSLKACPPTGNSTWVVFQGDKPTNHRKEKCTENHWVAATLEATPPPSHFHRFQPELRRKGGGFLQSHPLQATPSRSAYILLWETTFNMKVYNSYCSTWT